MSVPVIRGRVAVWGIHADAGDTYYAAIITGQRRGKEAENDFIFDTNGFTITEIFFDNKDKCDVDVICESGTTQPENGDSITIDAIVCQVQSSEVKWEQKGWKKLSIKATKFANLVP